MESMRPQPLLGPRRVWHGEAREGVGADGRDAASLTPQCDSDVSEDVVPGDLRTRLSLAADERVLLLTTKDLTTTRQEEVVLTDAAVYLVYGASSAGQGLAWLRGALSGAFVGSKPPRERHGWQQWRHERGLVVTRLDLGLIEAVDSLDGRIRLFVPRSSVPKEAAENSSTALAAGDPLRAALGYQVGAEACALWRLAVQRATCAHWQAMLEARCMLAPEVYQAHARAKQLPPPASGRKGSSGSGAVLSRLLAFSDRSVYTVHRAGVQLGSDAEWSKYELRTLLSLEQLALRDRRVPAYPFGLVLRFRPGASGSSYKGSASVGGGDGAPLPTPRSAGGAATGTTDSSASHRPVLIFGLKSLADLRRLTACARAAYRHQSGELLAVTVLQAPDAAGEQPEAAAGGDAHAAADD